MGALAWVEVLDHRGQVRTRHRIDAAPAIIGRGYGSDVLLDDPWLSPVHLRLFRELDGSLAVEDARSENGTWSPRGERVTALPIGPGVVLCARGYSPFQVLSRQARACSCPIAAAPCSTTPHHLPKSRECQSHAGSEPASRS
ncbi:MAG TPA: FHA domain-containing protein [Gemmatimonadales bacterium]|nr:FHA domain-containing protein [Gemmatimonadales bacterium]